MTRGGITEVHLEVWDDLDVVDGVFLVGHGERGGTGSPR